MKNKSCSFGRLLCLQITLALNEFDEALAEGAYTKAEECAARVRKMGGEFVNIAGDLESAVHNAEHDDQKREEVA